MHSVIPHYKDKTSEQMWWTVQKPVRLWGFYADWVVWKQNIILSSVLHALISVKRLHALFQLLFIQLSFRPLFTRAIFPLTNKKNGCLCFGVLMWCSKCVIMAVLLSRSLFTLFLCSMCWFLPSPQKPRPINLLLENQLESFSIKCFPYTNQLNNGWVLSLL